MTEMKPIRFYPDYDNTFLPDAGQHRELMSLINAKSDLCIDLDGATIQLRFYEKGRSDGISVWTYVDGLDFTYCFGLYNNGWIRLIRSGRIEYTYIDEDEVKAKRMKMYIIFGGVILLCAFFPPLFMIAVIISIVAAIIKAVDYFSESKAVNRGKDRFKKTLVVCRRCDQKNSVDLNRPGRAKCGNCGNYL